MVGGSALSLTVNLLLTYDAKVTGARRLALRRHVTLLRRHLRTTRVQTTGTRDRIGRLRARRTTRVHRVGTTRNGAPMGKRTATRSTGGGSASPGLLLSNCNSLGVCNSMRFGVSTRDGRNLLTVAGTSIGDSPAGRR